MLFAGITDSEVLSPVLLRWVYVVDISAFMYVAPKQIQWRKFLMGAAVGKNDYFCNVARFNVGNRTY